RCRQLLVHELVELLLEPRRGRGDRRLFLLSGDGLGHRSALIKSRSESSGSSSPGSTRLRYWPIALNNGSSQALNSTASSDPARWPYSVQLGTTKMSPSCQSSRVSPAIVVPLPDTT